MSVDTRSVDEFLQSLSGDRRLILSKVREVILEHLPAGYVECVQGEAIAYVVPHSLYPAGYHFDPRQPLRYAALTSEKNHLSLHLMSVYGDPAVEEWFRRAWQASGRKLDMGKACVRFRKLDDVPLDVVGQVIARVPLEAYVARIEKFMRSRSVAKSTRRS